MGARVLAFTDPHGSLDAARSIIDLANESKPDLIVCSGDISTFGSGYEGFLHLLQNLHRNIFFVPGNHDIPIALTIFSEWTYMKDATWAVLSASNAYVMGLPGSGQYWPSHRTNHEDCETPIALFSECPTSLPRILLTHFPPNGLRNVDGTGGGSSDEGGSSNVRFIVEEIRPDLVVCGHYHACFGGRGRIGDVQVVNPGPNGSVYDIRG